MQGSHVTDRECFEYKPLSDGQAIRLLNLHPGSGNEPLYCSLVTTGIGSGHLQYEAISYVWGDSSKSRLIVCDGHTLSITESLFTALQRFRSSHQVRTLWADAICIDQENVAERNLQVNRMGHIYRNASKVLVWLGHEEDTVVKTALNGICRYLKPLYPDGFKHEYPSYDWNESIVQQFGENDQSSNPIDEGVAGLTRICLCAWFSRGWVVQEVALAQTAYCYWGNARIRSDWISQAVSVVPRHIFHLRHIRRCYSVFIMRETQQNPQRLMSFQQLLGVCRYFEFTDPRDRIYGLLGLRATDSIPGEGTSFVVPDYGSSVMECYQRVTEKLLLDQHDLQVLTRIRHEHELKEDEPSWILRWNKWRFYRQRRCAAPLLASHLEPRISKESYGNHACISIDGFIIDTVSKKYPLPQLSSDKQDLRNRRDLIRNLSVTYSVDCLARTFGEPFDSGDEGTRPEWGENYDAFMQWDPADDDKKKQPSSNMHSKDFLKAMQSNMARDFAKAMEGNTSEQTIFTSEKGRLGIGPKILKSGDIIVFFLGATVPFVLRRAGDLWRFVGDCYMYEFIRCQDIASWNESGGATETFRIY